MWQPHGQRMRLPASCSRSCALSRQLAQLMRSATSSHQMCWTCSRGSASLLASFLAWMCFARSNTSLIALQQLRWSVTLVSVDLESVLEVRWGGWAHGTASSLTAGIGDQVSRRVDVPGGVPQPAVSSHKPHGHSGGTRNELLVPG